MPFRIEISIISSWYLLINVFLIFFIWKNIKYRNLLGASIRFHCLQWIIHIFVSIIKIRSTIRVQYFKYPNSFRIAFFNFGIISNNVLLINLVKYHSITFYRNRNVINSQYYIQNAPLSRESLVNNLGIIYDFKLIFDQHITSIWI